MGLIYKILIPLLIISFPAFSQISKPEKYSCEQLDSLISQVEELKLETDQKIERIEAALITSDDNCYLQIPKAYESIGLAYFSQNLFQSAIYKFEKAHEQYESLNDSTGVSRTLNRIGLCYYRLLRYEKAIDHFKQSLSIREKIGDKTLIASTLNNLANCFLAIKQHELAIDTYTRSYSLYKEMGDAKGQSFSLNNLGLIQMELGRNAQALEFFEKTLALKKSINDSSGVALTLGNIGVIQSLQGNYREALETYHRAANIYQEKQNNFGLAHVYSTIAEIELILNNPHRASSYLSKSKALAGDKDNTLYLKNLKIESDYNYTIGKIQESRDKLYEYNKATEKIFNQMISERIAELTFMFENERGEKEKQMLKVNLEVERLKIQNVKLFHLGLIFASFVLLLIAVFTVSVTIKVRKKNRQIQSMNEELNHINENLETLVQQRTADLKLALKKVEESDNFKSSFLANLSHEIRTPLNGILGFSKLLNDSNIPSETRKQYISIINKRGRNLLKIINDIINISQIDAGQVEITNSVFNLNQLLNDLYKIFNSDTYGSKKVNIELKTIRSLSDSKSYILADPNRLEQILVNLIDNAFKYTMSGSVEFGYYIDKNQTLLFFVRDTGIGIPDEERDLVFNRFYKAGRKNSTSGTGLGLPICKGLVELIGGQIWFDSVPHQGTTFYFTIPFIPTKSGNNNYFSLASLGENNLSFEGKVILVVEDDLNSYQIIEALLRDTKAKVIHSKNGEDAVEICKIIPDIDLVLMDMRLPFLSGYEATTQIKSIKPSLTIVAQTAYALSDDKANCFKAGCDDFIPKPIDPDDFLRIVAYHLLKQTTS